MNTVSTFTPITPLEAMQKLLDNMGEPIQGLAFKGGHSGTKWKIRTLEYVAPKQPEPFKTGDCPAVHCAIVTQLDPCKAPEGCPELEPWMAYVGNQPLDLKTETYEDLYRSTNNCAWLNSSGPHAIWFRAVDVRTEWAKKYFPEHCRIRNYQEPDPFEEIWNKEDSVSIRTLKERCRFFFERGQANPKPESK